MNPPSVIVFVVIAAHKKSSKRGWHRLRGHACDLSGFTLPGVPLPAWSRCCPSSAADAVGVSAARLIGQSGVAADVDDSQVGRLVGEVGAVDDLRDVVDARAPACAWRRGLVER